MRILALSHWVRRGRLKNRFEEGRAHQELRFGCVYEGLVKHPKEMLELSLLYTAPLTRAGGTSSRQLFCISVFLSFSLCPEVHI